MGECVCKRERDDGLMSCMPTSAQATKYGEDYADRVEEHRKAMIREEAKREEERIKRREEMYGSRADKEKARRPAAAAADGEIQVEDLGAVSLAS